MPFELPPWLTEPAHPFEALAKGAAVGVQLGKAFADNMYRNQAMYVRARQEQQEQDLRVRELGQRDASFALQSTIARTKMTHDAEDYEKLTSFVPTVSSAHTFDELNAVNLPPLHDTQNYLKMSLMLDRTKTEKAMSEMSAELAPTTNWADPKVREIVLKWFQKSPDLSTSTAGQHLMWRHQAAVEAKITADRLNQQMQNLSDYRTGRIGISRMIEERRALLTDSTIDLNDARIEKLNKEIGMAEREMSVKEKNVGLRGQEVALKEKRFDTAKWSPEDRMELKERAKVVQDDSALTSAEKDQSIQEIRGEIEGNRLQREKFKEAKTARVGLKEDFDAELKMANDAIAANPDRKAAIAEQFKKRTGRDLP